VAEKLSLIEQQKMEMERQQKVPCLPTFTSQIIKFWFWVTMLSNFHISNQWVLILSYHVFHYLKFCCLVYVPLQLAEEEEIRRLRKELIPKAQPMPYFDRPFIPRR